MRTPRRVILSVDDVYDGFASAARPRLSWRTEGMAPYGLGVTAHAEIRRGGRTEHARLDASDSVRRAWPFAPLRPRERVEVRVRVEPDDPEHGTWSDPVPLTGGTLDEWPAPFVTARTDAPVLMRRGFAVPRDVARATLYVSAFGAARARVNGLAVGDRELAPGWTSYQWRVDYDTYDVSDLVERGDNAIGLEVTGAWYTERYGFRDAAARFYDGPPSAAALLVVEHEHGPDTVLTTDAEWRWSTGGATGSSIYQGETFDARLVPAGWDRTGFDDAGWTAVAERVAAVTPTPRAAPPVRVTEEIAPVAVLPGDEGAVILDFGQNLVGRLRLRLRAPAGTRIRLRHAEVLEGGRLATRPLRNAAATDEYVAAGGEEEWEPTGTFHGFRFAEVSGWPGPIADGQVSARVLGTDLRRTGGFRTSHALLQKFHDNVVWGARGNFLSVPTDCPQRDERLGWTGDAQVFGPAAAFLFDCDAFFSSWLRDVRHEQRAADGIVPMVVPAVIPQVPGLFEPIAAWGDAVTVLPWAMREAFGGDEIIAENLDAMVAWVEAVRRRTGGAPLWEDGRQFGDWLDPDAPPDQPGKAAVDPDIVATAYFHRSARLTARAAALCGRTELAERYDALAIEIREEFAATYLTPAGRMMSDAPTAYALAIVFDLVDADRRQAAGDRLAELVRRRAYRIGTGFAGTPIVCDALSSTGHADAAVRLLLQTENPSWLYPVTMGATTVWERWDSLREDGTINPGQMTSFNHFALGAVVDWIHRSLGGLTALEPAYRRARFAPVFGDGIDDAAVWKETPYGRVEASWRREGGAVAVELTVPDGVAVEVELPGRRETVRTGTHRWSVTPTDAAASHAPPSLDGPMTDVLDSPAAYAAVMDELLAWDAERAAQLRRTISWTAGRRLRDPLDKVPVAVMDRIAARLHELAG